MKLRFAIIVLLSTIAATAQKAVTQEPRVPVDERAIYSAVLDKLWELKSSRHPLISEYTSTFDCKNECNGFKIGGCNGMRNADESPKETLDTVCSRGLKQLPSMLAAEFISKNGRCAKIVGPLLTKHEYHYFSLTDSKLNESVPKSWDHPDLIYFSRVAFDKSRKMALVYFGFMSGTDGSKSGGFYTQLDLVGSTWKITSSVQFWSMDTSSGL